MKKRIVSLLVLTLLAPVIASAHPGDGWRGSGWHDAPHGHGGGHGAMRFLPEAATAVLIGGLTYYLLNGNYYQRQNDSYVVVEPPQEEPRRALDYNGKRYYVSEGHYYQRDIAGEYLEVPRPPGL